MRNGKVIEAFNALEDVKDVEIDENIYTALLYRLGIEANELNISKFSHLINSPYAKVYRLLLKLSMGGRDAPEISEKTGLDIICVRRYLSVPKTRSLLYEYFAEFIDERTFFEKLKRD